jgi:hypothetical protein
MEHSSKIGKAINCTGIKFVKRLIKKKGIEFQGRFQRPNDCTIKVVNIRKYQNLYYSDKCVYEVDVTVKINEYYYTYFNRRNNIHANKRIRNYQNITDLLNELVYFNIKDIQISKITFEQ